MMWTYIYIYIINIHAYVEYIHAYIYIYTYINHYIFILFLFGHMFAQKSSVSYLDIAINGGHSQSIVKAGKLMP